MNPERPQWGNCNFKYQNFSGVETEPEMHEFVIETDSEAPNESERENQCERESESVVEYDAINDGDESEPELNFLPSVI